MLRSYEDVVERQATRPATELVTRSKLSCLAWNAQEQSQLIASDYEGIVTLWDAEVLAVVTVRVQPLVAAAHAVLRWVPLRQAHLAVPACTRGHSSADLLAQCVL